MRLSGTSLVALGALVALLALGATEAVLPASDPRTAELRPWLAARALGIAAYLLLAAEVGLGLILSHPQNALAWRLSKAAFPWHELLAVFTGAFLALHVALLALDPYARVGLVGAFVPGLAEYRTPAIAVGTVALYALVITAVTARWTKLLRPGWWLRIHRLAALAFLAAWMHGVLAGTDTPALLPLYLLTGLPVLAFVAHRWLVPRLRPGRGPRPVPAPALARAVPEEA